LDFELNPDQQSVLEAVEALLERHAGPARAIALQSKAGYDDELEQALSEAGFLDAARDPEMGPLEAALIVEAVARAGGVLAADTAALIAPALRDEPFAGPIAVTAADRCGPVRYASHARTLLVCDGDEARWTALPAGAVRSVASNFGYPMGAVDEALARSGTSLGPGSGERLRSWWRLALAVEAVGCMEAALGQTVAYLSQRRQFGRAIGSFQAVQHRLAVCAIQLEGSRWLAREAAWRRAEPESVATAAAYSLAAAAQVFAETHQLSGAIGFTREHDLHVWSMRLQALRLELGGVTEHRSALVQARWSGRES